MSSTGTLDHLLARVRRVRRNLGLDDEPLTAETRLGDVLDSMAMVEFLGLLAEDCGVKPSAVEECVGRRFGTVRELAEAMGRANLSYPAASGREASSAQYPVLSTEYSVPHSPARPPGALLAATAVRLPGTLQPAAELDVILQRPPGWFERHAGIRGRRLWRDENPLAAATDAGQACLDQAGLSVRDLGAVLVTSEAPPLLVGLAAALHSRLQLTPQTAALEIGGACTGFLAALWTAQRLLPTTGPVLVIAVEAPSRYLCVEPGPAGEAAALFGDGAAACLLTAQPTGPDALALREVLLGADGDAGTLLRVERHEDGVALHMEGTALAERAIETMAGTLRTLLERHGLRVEDLRALVAHGGNGRMPGLLARQLGLPEEQVWSTTPQTGNLGSASLPAAWASQAPAAGPVAWVGVGAGLTWGAALLA